MITIRKSNNPAFGRPSVQAPEATTPSLGTNSKTMQTKEADKWKSTSAGIPTGAPNMTIGGNQLTIDLEPMLMGMTPQTDYLLHSIYRDIYYMDSVAGSAVDMISNLPFSDFTLGGIDDPKVNTVFQEVLERLNVKTLLPELSADYLVHGAHISSLLYNKEKKQFTDIMPHSSSSCVIESIPFYSQDPIITVKFNSQVTAVLAKDSPRIRRLKETVGAKVIDEILAGEIELQPMNTLYIPRRTFSDSPIGTSYFKRILPLFLIEKNLFRGTLVESGRRQRGIMHLTLGDGDQWEPTTADMEFMTELFMNADSDPLGAIIATKAGVMVEEIRQGGDFWKCTDFADSAMPYKLRALGLSEGLLSGDANFNTADTSLTVFLDMIQTYRDMITRKFFYNKIFPLVSLINGYAVNSKGKVAVRDLTSELSQADLMFKLQDGSKLLIPTVSWSKQLKPAGDQAYIEMLDGITQKGVPVPLRVLAAAGGLNLDDLLKQQDDDLAIRKDVGDYLKKIAALAPKPAEEGGDMMGEASDAARIFASVDPTGATRSAVHALRGKPALLNRDFGAASEVIATSKTGKPRVEHNQKRANERINMNLARAMTAAKERGRFKERVVSFLP